MKRISLVAVVLIGLFFTGCAAALRSSTYLPSSKTTISAPWKSFEKAKASYDKIIPGKTTIEELKKLGFDPYETPNIKILNSTDIVNRFMPNPSIKKEDLDEGIQKAIEAKDRCFGYLIEPYVSDEKNTANFWLHVMKFKRETKESGWQFRGLVLIVDDIVVYKDPVGGQPKIDVKKVKKNPLGPLQELGDIVIGIGKIFTP